MRSSYLLSCLFVVPLVVLPLSASASVVVALSEPELVARADAIVVGTVVRTRAFVDPRGFVFTRADFQIMQGLVGPRLGDVVTLEVPGGELPNGMRSMVPGAPELAAGQMYVGFLERHGERFRPMGMSFGLLTVHEVAPGDLRVFRSLEGLALVTPAGRETPPGTYVIDNMRLNDFMRRLAAERDASGVRPPPESDPKVNR